MSKYFQAYFGKLYNELDDASRLSNQHLGFASSPKKDRKTQPGPTDPTVSTSSFFSDQLDQNHNNLALKILSNALQNVASHTRTHMGTPSNIQIHTTRRRVHT